MNQAFLESLKPADPTPDVVAPAEQPQPESASPAPSAEAESPRQTESGEPKAKSEKSESEGQLATIIAERKKRQKAEAELAYYRGLAEGRSVPAKEEAPKGPTKEELENEYLLDPRGVTTRLVQEHIDNAIYQDRLARSIAVARREFKDWDSLLEKHATLVPDEALQRQIRNHPEPARFVYEYLKAQERMSLVNQDPAEYEKRLRTEIEAKVRKELALQEAAETPTTPANGPAGGQSPATPVATVEDLFASRRNRKR